MGTSIFRIFTVFVLWNLILQISCQKIESYPPKPGATGVISHEGKVYMFYGDKLSTHAWNLQESGYDGVEFTLVSGKPEYSETRAFAKKTLPGPEESKDPDRKSWRMDEKPPAEFSYKDGSSSTQDLKRKVR